MSIMPEERSEQQKAEDFFLALTNPHAALCCHPDDVPSLGDCRFVLVFAEVVKMRERSGMEPLAIIPNRFIERGQLFVIANTRPDLDEFMMPKFQFTVATCMTSS